MGSSSHETVQEHKEDPGEYVIIQLPDPKLFKFAPNFLKDCDNIKKSTYSDSEYNGQIKDGKRNGKGIMSWNNGDIYQGEFKDGYRHGKGIYKYNTGAIYNGEWNMGFAEGLGIMKYTDSYYEGEWKKDKRNGKGKMIWTDENGKGIIIYEGEFKDGYRHGKGICKYKKTGEIYDGEWKKGNFN